MQYTVSWLKVLCLVSLFTFCTARAFAKDPHCSEIGGVILTNLGGFGTIDNNPTTMGVATGDLKGAIGVEILSISADYSTFSVQHHWVTDSGETLTIDNAQAHGTFVGPGLYAITDYKIHLSGGTGRFADASGHMTAIGEIDFNSGQVVLRYSGKVCHAE
ncbi:MAG TPA: hypothetical protein VJO35_18430 [Terriglobales bacterium]|nr:hypothetical protein [Terriglobales bacterium]